ncbi:MAG: tetratricopeptide repeat protein [Anaerolineae bacterium]|nr:tetratricopeptide repeat protein [Anaerolineae bacterium]
MRTRNRPLLRLAVGAAALLSLALLCLCTPLGPWLASRASDLWRGIGSLPGVSVAREYLQATPEPDGKAGGAGSPGSATVRDLLRKAMALQEKGELQDALARYREALDLDERYAPTHASLASLYRQLGREDEALRELERAAELEPDNPYILAPLGQLYLEREEYDKSVAVLERARALEPAEAQIRSVLGAAYYYRSYADQEKAVAELEEAVALAPGDARAQYGLALAYMRRDGPQDRERAIRAMEKVLELDDTQTEPYLYLGQLYARGGEREKAIAAWQRYLAVGQDAESLEQVRQWLRTLEEGQE